MRPTVNLLWPYASLERPGPVPSVPLPDINKRSDDTPRRPPID